MESYGTSRPSSSKRAFSVATIFLSFILLIAFCLSAVPAAFAAENELAFFPLLYKWDLRQAAVKLARKLGGGARELEEGEFRPLSRAGSRVYKV